MWTVTTLATLIYKCTLDISTMPIYIKQEFCFNIPRLIEPLLDFYLLMPGTYVSFINSNNVLSRNVDKIKTFYMDGGTGDVSEGYIWHYPLWSFKTRDTKLDRFLYKNQHTKGNF